MQAEGVSAIHLRIKYFLKIKYRPKGLGRFGRSYKEDKKNPAVISHSRVLFEMAPAVGFEPTTTRLTVGGSTAELRRNKLLRQTHLPLGFPLGRCGGRTRNRTEVRGFAVPCITTLPSGRIFVFSNRFASLPSLPGVEVAVYIGHFGGGQQEFSKKFIFFDGEGLGKAYGVMEV